MLIVQNYDALIVGNKFPANAQFLNSVSQLKLLAVIGNRVDNVDLEEANNKNIAVTR
jgi:lactate dehydrogenase-like 2-hydroxyacid dehydrogenase